MAAKPHLCAAPSSDVLVQLQHQRHPWLTGMELLSHANQNNLFLPTRLQPIDVLLGGGLREGQLTEIAGPSSSGKTQLCLSSAVHTVDKNFGTVLYLDTSNSFSPNQVRSFVNEAYPSLPKEAKGKRLQMIMSNIYYQSVFDIFALLDLLHHVDSTLKHTVNSGGSKLCLLIIDSVSSLIAPIIGGKNSQGWYIMASVGILLKRIAYEHNILVVVNTVTNHMVGGENGMLKPALGESWKGIPHVRLLLPRCTSTNHGTATVLKHTLLASGRTNNFVIHNRRSRDYMPFSMDKTYSVKLRSMFSDKFVSKKISHR